MLRGAGGLRGVRPRQGSRATGSRPSSGRGPSARVRWERASGPPRAIDRAEPLTFAGLHGPIAARLLGPIDDGARPLVATWGAGGSSQRELDADDAWARELADLTGAIVVLCGYRRADAESATADVMAAYAELVARAELLGADPSRIAVTGRGLGFRLAARLASDAASWPTLATPRRCLSAAPVPLAAAELRDALGLAAAALPLHGVRVGAEVLSRDGRSLGRIHELREGDVVIRRGLTLADLAVPLRLLRPQQGAVTVEVRAAAIPLRDWGAAAVDLAAGPRASNN
jgi:hypothetical protein